MEIFPGDQLSSDDVQSLFDELHKADLVRTYEVEGSWFIAVTGWYHQRIDKPRFKYPEPKQTYKFDEQTKQFHEQSSNGSRMVSEESAQEWSGVERSGEERSRQEVAGATLSSGDPTTESKKSPSEIFDLIQAMLLAAKLSAPRKLTDARRRRIRSRLMENGWVKDLQAAGRLLPVPGDGWQPDIDWLIADATNVQKILEAKYDWRGRTNEKQKRKHLSVAEMMKGAPDDEK